MFRYLRILSVLIAAGALGAACAKPVEPTLPPLSAAEISGARLWQRISSESDYDHWAFWPGHEGMRPGQSPHGRFHEVYVNNTLATALPIAARKAPAGAIIVKENFDANKKLTGLTVMAKVEGYNPDRGDWFWAAYAPDGKVNAEGKPQSCIDCHAGMKDNDYVIIRRLEAPITPK
jgi:hypothetical protein